MKAPATLADGPLILRPVEEADRDAVHELLTTPEVARWWVTAPGTRPDEGFYDDQERSFWVWVVEHEGRLAGVLMGSEEPDPSYRHAGLDIALHPDMHGRGIGPQALRLAVDHLVAERGHHRVTIDPAADNARAIRAYEKAGFRPVGRMRSYEADGEGGWRDGLLMERVIEPVASGGP